MDRGHWRSVPTAVGVTCLGCADSGRNKARNRAACAPALRRSVGLRAVVCQESAKQHKLDVFRLSLQAVQLAAPGVGLGYSIQSCLHVRACVPTHLSSNSMFPGMHASRHNIYQDT